MPLDSLRLRWLAGALVGRRWRAIGWLAVLGLAAIMFWSHLGERQLAKSDEVLYAAAAVEMAQGGAWLFPTEGFGTYTYMGKPPGGVWPMAVLFRLFGHTKALARAPIALAGVVAMGLIALLTFLITGSSLAAFVTALTVLGQTQWVTDARAIWLENYLTPLFLLALLCDAFARTEPAPRRRLGLQLLCGLAVGYATLTKHLVGFAPLVALLAAELFINPRLALQPRQLVRRFGVQVAVSMGCFAAWLGCFLVLRGARETGVALVNKLAADAAKPRSPNDLWPALVGILDPWWIGAGLVAMLALLVALPARAAHAKVSARGPAAERGVFLLAALLVLALTHFAVFGLLASKLRGWYLLPALPLLGMFVGLTVFLALRPRGALLRAAAWLSVAALAVAALDERAHFMRWAVWGLVVVMAARWLGIWLSQVPLVGPALRRYRVGAALLPLALLAAVLPATWSTYRAVRTPPPADGLQEAAELFRRTKPARLVIDQTNWERYNYFQPSVFFYFAPLDLVPHKLDIPCDISDLPAGEWVQLHHTRMKCVESRVARTINLTEFWRLVLLK